MSSSRIAYHNWIVELGFDPMLGPADGQAEPGEIASDSHAEQERVQRIRSAVQAALAELTEDERELIERTHLMGQSFPELAASTGRALHRLESMYSRAVRKLRRRLYPLVEELYGLNRQQHEACPICTSRHRRAIDRIIAKRDPQATWRPVIREIERRFGLKIEAPQILIGHSKYH